MGQQIEISETTIDGAIAAFHTDRGITGQDGVGFASRDAADGAESLPGDLALRLFESDDSIDHVFVASNQVVARRPDGWSKLAQAAAGEVITSFFVFYSGA